MEASPDANLSSNVQTTHNTSTNTDSVVYIYYIKSYVKYCISYCTYIRYLFAQQLGQKWRFQKLPIFPTNKQTKKSPAICSAKNPRLRIYVAGAPVGFFPPQNLHKGDAAWSSLKLYSRPKKFDK